MEAQQTALHPVFNPNEVPLAGLSLFKPDWMHTKTLGTDSWLLGSCILFLVKHVLPGTADQNIGVVWEAIQHYYRANGTPCRLSRLTLNMVKNEPFPRLSAKAMETRHLVPAVEHFARAWVGNPLVARFHLLLQLSHGLDELVFSNKTLVLSGEERTVLKVGIFKYNQALSTLSNYCIQRGLPFFNFTIKNHMMCHIGLQAFESGVSPRLGFCFEGEDFMALVKRLCQGSNRGIESAKLTEKVIPKYLRGLDLIFKHC